MREPQVRYAKGPQTRFITLGLLTHKRPKCCEANTPVLCLIVHLLNPAWEGQKQNARGVKKENKSRSGQRVKKQASWGEWVSSWHGFGDTVGTLKLDEKLKPWFRTGLDFLRILQTRYFINAWEWWGQWGYAPKMSNSEEEQFCRGSVKGQWWERRKLLSACLFLIPACSINCIYFTFVSILKLCDVCAIAVQIKPVCDSL